MISCPKSDEVFFQKRHRTGKFSHFFLLVLKMSVLRGFLLFLFFWWGCLVHCIEELHSRVSKALKRKKIPARSTERKDEESIIKQGSLNYPGGIKQCKCMVILRDFSYNSALFGLVSYNDPCKGYFKFDWL